MRLRLLLLCGLFLCISKTHALQLTRVILASDTNPMYIEFWPIVARVWKELIGIQPTLLLIAPPEFVIDETIGDVLRFEPIPGVPTNLQAQTVRLFGPAFFPDDGCIISDIDTMPLNKEYFVYSVAPHRDDQFITFRDKADQQYLDNERYPMCYNAAKGRVFGEIFNIKTRADVTQRIVEWYSLNHGWNTDEVMLAECVKAWDYVQHRHVKLGYSAVTARTIGRYYWQYSSEFMREKYYIDAHLLRPYSEYKEYVDAMLICIGLNI